MTFRLLSSALLVSIIGCGGSTSEGIRLEYCECFNTRMNQHPLWKAIPDDNVDFSFNSELPFYISIGRGSGRCGLNILSYHSDGESTLLCQTNPQQSDEERQEWYLAHCSLPEQGRLVVLNALASHDICKLHREYHANVADGTQWILRMSQSGKEKTVYCNNYCPHALLQLIQCIDQAFQDGELTELRWIPANLATAKRHQGVLWKAIQR